MSLLIVKKNIQLTYLFLRKFPIYTDICVYIYANAFIHLHEHREICARFLARRQ